MAIRHCLTGMAIGLRLLPDRACPRAVEQGDLESAITSTRSVDIVGTYQPLDSGFNYMQLGVVPKPVSAYR